MKENEVLLFIIVRYIANKQTQTNKQTNKYNTTTQQYITQTVRGLFEPAIRECKS